MTHTARMQQWEVRREAHQTLLDERRALVDRLQSFHDEYLRLQQADVGEEERRAQLSSLFERELDLLQQAAPIWQATDRLLREGRAWLRTEREWLREGHASHAHTSPEGRTTMRP